MVDTNPGTSVKVDKLRSTYLRNEFTLATNDLRQSRRRPPNPNRLAPDCPRLCVHGRACGLVGEGGLGSARG